MFMSRGQRMSSTLLYHSPLWQGLLLGAVLVASKHLSPSSIVLGVKEHTSTTDILCGYSGF